MISEDVRVGLCQQEILKLDLSIKCNIQEIRDCSTEPEILNSLNNQVQDKVMQLREKYLEKLAKEQETLPEEDLILVHASNHRKQLQSTLAVLRRSNLKSQALMENFMRNSLLSSHEGLKNRNSLKDSMSKSTRAVTERMLEITRIMSEQAKHGAETADQIIVSSDVIEETSGEFHSMAGYIKNTHRIMTKYGRRDITDRLLIGIAFLFFLICVLFIVKKRLFPNLFMWN